MYLADAIIQSDLQKRNITSIHHSQLHL